MAAGPAFCWKAVCLLKSTCLLHAWRLLTLGLLMSNWFAQGEELVLSKPMWWLKALGLLEANGSVEGHTFAECLAFAETN